MIDLTGQKFNRFTVIKYDDTRNPYPSPYWICKCECGNLKSVRSDHLRKGEIQSCGCLQKEVSSVLGKKQIQKIAGHNRIDIIGQKFGELVAIECIQQGDRTHDSKWLCQCSCGAKTIVHKRNLLIGHTTSCGCKMSQFEKEVCELLSKNNISYERNKTFSTCKMPSGIYAKFDFYVDNKYVIECDGRQHKHPEGSRFSQEIVDLIIKRDMYKNQWCKDNNIPIIRLPYECKNHISLDDIQIETTKYLYG